MSRVVVRLAGLGLVLGGACGDQPAVPSGAPEAAVPPTAVARKVAPPSPELIAVPVPGPPQVPAPVLTAAQEEQLRAAARADPGVGHLLVQGQLRDAVAPAYGENRDLLGGVVRIVFDPPAEVDFQAPVAGCIDGRERRVLQRVEAGNVRGVAVVVHFSNGVRVERALVEPSAAPGPQASVRVTTLRDLEPPGVRCRNEPSGD